MKTPLRVLHLEDDPRDAELVRETLEAAGFAPEIVVVQTKADYLAQLDRGWEIILADYTLPQFDGLQALELLKERGIDVPFILVSGAIGEEAAIATMQAGASDYVLKNQPGRLGPAVERGMREAVERRMRKQAEEKLRESEQNYRTLANSGQALVWASGTDKLCYYFNAVWLQFTGRTLEQELGNGWAEGVHPDDFERCLHTYVEAFERQAPFSMEYRLRRHDGAYRWLIDDGCPRYDSQGAFIGYIGHCLDITERKEAESMAQLERALTQTIIQSIPGTFYVIGEDGRYIDGNSYHRNEIVGPERRLTETRAADTIHPDDRAFITEIITSVLATGTEESVEARVLLRGGPDFRWFLLTGRRMTVQGRPVLIGIGIDITERKRAEEALAASEAQHRHLIQNLRAGIVVHAPDTRILLHNQTALDLLGWSAEQMLGKVALDPAWCFVHEDKTPMAVAEYPVTRVITTCAPVHDLVLGILSPLTNDCVWVLVNAFPEFASSGQIQQVVVTFVDITERKKIEESLVLAMDRLQLAAKAGGVGMWEYDVITGHLVWDDQMASLYGIDRESFSGAYERWRASIHPEDQARVDREIEWALQGSKDFNTEFRVLWPDGTIREIRALARVQRSATNQPLQMIGTNWDITDQKRMEESLRDALDRAEAGSRTKSEFLAVMSHELRTPLNGVLGFAELLSETDLDEEQEAFAATIIKSGSHLLAIVNDVLDFSSIEKGTMSISTEPLAVADLVQDSERAVLKSAMEKEIALQSTIGPGTPEQILGDGQRIRQILINLLGNAVKFTSSGSVTIRIETVSEGAARFLDFSVEDTGIGIPPEAIQNLFKPFTQAEMKLNRKYGGTGLGLAISQRLAEAMGGKITVVSAMGRGSTFTFRLPVKMPAPYAANTITPSPSAPVARSNASDDAAPVAGQTPANRPVLVVDDDSTNCTLVGKILPMLGYRAEFAADGAEALAAFSPGKYSVILMDIQMPVMNGIEATKKIRELESGERVPIIALTAKVMPGDRDQCLAAGMDDYIGKPFTRAELAEKLASVIFKRSEAKPPKTPLLPK